MLLYQAADMLQCSLELVGFENIRQTCVRKQKNLEHFATFIVAPPEALAALWMDVQGTIDFNPTK